MVHLPYSCRIATAQQCRDADRYTIEEFGIEGFTLMETAGMQAARHIAEMAGEQLLSLRNRRAEAAGAGHRSKDSAEAATLTGLFYCGKGNNGGDAMVTARYLAIQHGHTCHILLPAGKEGLSPDCARNLLLLEKLQRAGYPITISAEGKNLQPDYVVDGLLGTGLDSPVRSPLDRAIAEINQTDCPVYSMDVPSGLHSDFGEPLPDAVRADITFSFGLLKPGFYLASGPGHCGQVIPCNLTFPEAACDGVADLITPDLLENLPVPARTARHKYSDRTVTIIAGSDGLTGAAILSARAAWRSGAGAVFLITPAGKLTVYEQALPEMVKLPVGMPDHTHFRAEHCEAVLAHLERRDSVLLIGPGVGRNPSTGDFVREVLTRFDGPALADADALHHWPKSHQRPEGETILTPHTGELDALDDQPPEEGFQRLDWTGRTARTRGFYLVSKGSPTIVGTPSGRRYVTGYDTSLFARAGFGDLLAGTIAGYWAITGEAETSILRALLEGKRNADRHLASHGRQPEPAELL